MQKHINQKEEITLKWLIANTLRKKEIVCKVNSKETLYLFFCWQARIYKLIRIKFITAIIPIGKLTSKTQRFQQNITKFGNKLTTLKKSSPTIPAFAPLKDYKEIFGT